GMPAARRHSAPTAQAGRARSRACPPRPAGPAPRGTAGTPHRPPRADTRRPRSRRTHRGEIEAGEFPPEAVDEAFRLFRAALAPLAEAGKLGYVLFQLAPWVRYDDARLAYLASLPARLPGWTVAVEFRHRSWLPDHAHEALGTLRRAGAAHVVVDAPVVAGAVPRMAVVTAPVAVFR